MENWTEIKITVDADRVDEAGNIATMTVPYGIYIEDYRNLEEEARAIAKIDLIDEELLRKDRTKGIVHIYISPEENPQEAVSFIEDRLKDDGIEYKTELLNCAREDWENNWKKYFKPIKVGEKLLIRPAWIDDYDADGRAVLTLEPGVAFGTGTHETTRLCMVSLENHIFDGCEMLDVGCGSGILSVAGMLLGAKSITGVDIDRLAVKVAVENGKMNGFAAPQFNMIHGDLTDKISGKYDVVTANIVADAIIKLTPGIKSFLKDDAVYIVSGIIDTREEDVLPVLAENGFAVIERRTEGGWVCLTCKL